MKAMEKFFASPLFAENEATNDQLRIYGRVFWPIQVSFIVGLPELTGTICKEIGRLALGGDNHAEESRLKGALRYMFPPTIDELGHGRDKYNCVHHDLFAAQIKACTGLSQEDLRKTWIRGVANQALAEEISESMKDVVRGLHMMYVVETLAPRFFVHQERVFLSSNEGNKVMHSTMHKDTEIEHADEADKFMSYIKRDQGLLDYYFGLWRALADEMHQAMYVQSDAVSVVA